jgi:hypothetical protein
VDKRTEQERQDDELLRRLWFRSWYWIGRAAYAILKGILWLVFYAAFLVAWVIGAEWFDAHVPSWGWLIYSVLFIVVAMLVARLARRFITRKRS